MAKIPLLFVHDAAIDEYIATALLATMPEVDLRGVIVVNADCVAGPAMSTAWKIHSLIDRVHVPLGLSKVRGWNCFPWPYRSDCIAEGNISVLAKIPPNPEWPEIPLTPQSIPKGSPNEANLALPSHPSGDALMRNILENAVAAKMPITLLVTAPLTTLSNTLRESPGLAAGIDRLLWMGGAISPVGGNLDPSTIPAVIANSYAEWNAFWDPYALHWILQNTQFPITIFPLNVTNDVKITASFLQRLAVQAAKFTFSRLAFESYLLVGNEPFYCMWDVLTACYVARPDLFAQPQTMRLNVVTEGYFQGAIIVDNKAARAVDVVLKLKDPGEFYSYILAQFER
jgi:purine nucleosidase